MKKQICSFIGKQIGKNYQKHVINFTCGSITYYIAVFLFISLLHSCITVKNAPSKPFVFSNKVVFKDKLSKDNKQTLESEIAVYWDDSLQAKKLTKFGVFKVLKNPPVFDSLNMIRTQTYMKNYLKSQGYYSPQLYDSIVKTNYKNQVRVTPIITINLGKSTTIDSVAFSMNDSLQQQLVMANAKKTFLQKGVPFAKQTIRSELDRITGIMRDNGYLLFNRDNVYAYVDTIDSRLLELKLNPFDQLDLVAKFEQAQKENPKWDVTIKQRKDSTQQSYTQYYIGTSKYYTQSNDESIDLLENYAWKKRVQIGLDSVFYNKKNIELAPIKEFIFLKRDSLYSEANYYKTINALSKLGPFKQVETKFEFRGKDTVDVLYFLKPEKLWNLDFTSEVSRNTGDIAAGNLMGISTGITLRNRNAWKRSIQSFTSLRTGIELNLVDTTRVVQTFFINFNQTFTLPRLLGLNNSKLKLFKGMVNAENKRTLLSFNGSYTDRFQIFKLSSITASLGYEWKRKNNVMLWRPLNLELYNLDKQKGLDDLIAANPFLQLSFNTGNVLGGSFTYFNNHVSGNKPYVSHFTRISLESSGLLPGFVVPSLLKNMYRYVKVEAEYRHNIKLNKNEFTYRGFLGFGYNYNNNAEIGKVLPFFKQFAAGGPNSMRAWGIRQLGLGSSLLSDTASSSFKDRFGDMQLELNFEYRFNIFSSSIVKIGSAIFFDIGNVWNIKKDATNPNGEFNFSRLGKDIAVGVGTGVRLDFSYFLIRLDWAYKLKDPARNYNDGWVDFKRSGFREKRDNGTEVRNFAFQLGIGLPF